MTVAGNDRRNDDTDRDTLTDIDPLGQRPGPSAYDWRQSSVASPAATTHPSLLSRSRTPDREVRSPGRRLPPQRWLILAVGLVVLVGVVSLLYNAHATIDRQDAEITLLVRNVAVVSNERDALTADRDRLKVSLDAEGAKASAAEASATDLQGRLASAEAQFAEVRDQLSGVSTELDRAKGDIGTLRERTQTAQGDARDASSAAAAATAARRRAETLSAAALAFADASVALSQTRNRMIDLSRQQITAERAGRSAEANAYLAEYNGLVTVHNRQLDASNAALAKLREQL